MRSPNILVVASAVVCAADCGSQTTSPSTVTAALPSYVGGFVTDRLQRALADVVVHVTDGPMTGVEVRTDGRGRFTVTGNAQGPVNLYFSKEGYLPKTITESWTPESTRPPIPPDDPGKTRVALDLVGAQLVIERGDYTMTLTTDLTTASGSLTTPCTGFPADLARRSYPVTIEPPTTADGFTRIVYGVADYRLSSQTLPFRPSIVGLGIAGQFVGFELENGFGGPLEELPGLRYVDISGNAPTSEPATSTGSRISIPFHGTFEYCKLTTPIYPPYYYHSCGQVAFFAQDWIVEHRACVSDHGTMTFTPR